MNEDFVEYFSLEEYVEKIRLLDKLLFHMDDTSKEFDQYMKLLSQYDDEKIINYWIHMTYQELKYSQHIESAKFNEEVLKEKGVFFDKLSISHKRINDLHNFVICSSNEVLEGNSTYRNIPVNVSRYNADGSEDIFWRGARPENVYQFMNDFIELYKQNKISLIYNNPFLSGAIMSLLFVRIHPYRDGNGRTSRIIYNLKFTEQVNKSYQVNLRLSPLNISNRILANKLTYVKRINQIPFNLRDDGNEAINNWFDFILDMADEQLYYAKACLDRAITETMPETLPNTQILKRVKQMKMSGIK